MIDITILYLLKLYMQKNFLIKKSSNISRKTAKTQPSSHLLMTSRSSTHYTIASQRYHLKQIQRRIQDMWDVVLSMNMEISKQVVMKFIKKTTAKRAYRFADLIVECCQSSIGAKMPAKSEQMNFEILIYQLDKLKLEVQEFLWRKFCKDVDILEEKIKKEDENIRNSLDLDQYQTLTGSFRPFLISSPADLIEQFQGIGTYPSKRNCSKLQQMRYEKLGKSARNVSNLHNLVCEEKIGIRISCI